MIPRVSNPDKADFDCQFLLHTYYACPSISTTLVKGMKGHKGVESVTLGSRRGIFLVVKLEIEFVEEAEEIHFESETDAKYHEVSNPVRKIRLIDCLDHH